MEEPVDTLGAVMREVAAANRRALEQGHVLAKVRMRPPASRPPLRRVMPRLRFALPVLALATAVVLWFGRTTVREGQESASQAPLSFSVGDSTSAAGKAGDRLEATTAQPITLHFSDRSQVTLQHGGRLQVAALGPRGAELRLERGRAEVAVRHRPDTRWQLQAGPFVVTVTGTRFSIDWNDQQEALAVVMTDGAVEVRGPGVGNQSPVVVSAGQRFSGSARDSRWTLAADSSGPAAEPAPAEAPVAAGAPGARRPGAGAAAARTSPSARAAPETDSGAWQTLAQAGRYPEALKMAERAGFERACQRLGAADLLQLGDTARWARNPDRAEAAYRAARKRFPANDRPAFALGLVAFEQRHDYRAAARWFELYTRTYPDGPLAREAAGREMESWQRAGDAVRARRAARDYLDQAPTGPYAPLARQLSAR